MTPISPAHTFTFAGTTHNVYHANTSQGLPMHVHNYPHATVCHAGRCVIRKAGIELIVTKGSNPIVLKGTEPHEIEALEEGTVFENIFVTGST
jgi:hypothetical protein